MKVNILSSEWYPVYRAVEVDPDEPDDGQRTYEIDQATLFRWAAVEAAFGRVQREMRDHVDPPCPKCGHRTSRHQEHSAESNDWGCLAWDTTPEGERTKRCRCRHGCPPERLAELEQPNNTNRRNA